MIIGNRDTSDRPLLIAEIGNNHEGDPVRAIELVEAAVEAGADAVKVQIIDPAKLVNIAQAERIAQLTRFRLADEVFAEMAARVRGKGASFLASVFDCQGLESWRTELDAVKIASGDLDFDPLLRIAAQSGKPIVLSTGMATLAEIRHAVDVIEAALPPAGPLAERLAVLHCVSLYPTALEQANLLAIRTIAENLNVTPGYSDHTLGIEACVAAGVLGARVIEKHFTLDKSRATFRDHALSADPADLARLAAVLESLPAMLGTGDREEVGADAETREAARRSIVASRPLAAGAVLEMADLDFVRPASGLPPTDAARLVGKRLLRGIARHESIRAADIDWN